MADEFVQTESRGYFSRVASSFFGVLIGILLIPGSVVLLSWNEYRTLHRSQGIDEGEKVVATVSDPQQVSSELDQRLVYLQGRAETEETLRDPLLNFERKALRIRRKVQHYEWEETENTTTRQKFGGGEERVTTYSYHKRWVNNHQPSGKFKQSIGHENPTPKYVTETINATDVNVGAYHLSASLIGRIDSFQETPVENESVFSSISETERPSYKLEDKGIYFSPTNSIAPPAVGDQKIHFERVDPCVVSLIAAQHNGKLMPFRTPNGEQLETLLVGEFTSADLFQSLRRENTLWAWVFRAGGFFLATVGFMLMMGPISTLASIIPFMENITGFMTMVVSVILGSIVALVTIGVAWFAVRPLFSAALFGVAILCLFFLFRGKSKPLPEVIQDPTFQ